MFGNGAGEVSHRSHCFGSLAHANPKVNNPPDNNRSFRVRPPRSRPSRPRILIRFAQLESADLVVPNMDAWRLLWDFRTLKDLAKQLPDNSPLGTKCMETANSIMNVFKHDDLSTIKQARSLAEKVFGKGWEKLGADIYKGDPSDSFTWGVGASFALFSV